MHLTLRPSDLDDFASIPARWREEARAWIRGLEQLKAGLLTKAELCTLMGASRQTVDRKIKAATEHGWRGLVPSYKPAAGLPPEFIEHWRRLVESYQRKTRPAWRALLRQWHAREPIPGYAGHPGWPNLPTGWTERNLYRQVPTKLELTAMRHGLGRAIARHAPKVLSTRVGTWHLSHILWDDVWLDAMAHMLQQRQLVRVLQIGALDLHSGCRFHYGTRPQLRRETDGKKDGLKEADMRFALAAQLHQFGISPRGTTMIVEHGTAAIRDRVRDVLRCSFGDLIQISDSGITGKLQAVAGLEGRGGGNFRHKAALESLHNLMHNELAALPAQTGHDRDEPEMLHGLRREHEQLWRIAHTLPEHVVSMLKFPALEYHSQFLPVLRAVLEAINARTDHDLEGWEALGYITREYRLTLGSDDWTPEQDLAPALVPAMRHMIIAEPALMRVRKLSPREVFDRNREQTQPVPPSVIADILYQDLARARQCRDGYFEFADQELSPEAMHFESRVTTADGSQIELRDRETYEIIVNPFDPSQAWVYSGRAKQGSFLGLAARVQRASRADPDATAAAVRRAKARLADQIRPARERHTHIAGAIIDRTNHNARVLAAHRQAGADLTARANTLLAAAAKPTPQPTADDEEPNW
jgi:hypothetical protein